MVFFFRVLLTSLFLLFAGKELLYSQVAEKSQEIDDILKTLSRREKIAQLFIVAISTDSLDSSYDQALALIKKEKIGGVILMESSLKDYAKRINHLQSISKLPLMVTIDGEWGTAMRIDSVISFPRQMQLGALSSDSLVYKMGKMIANQCRRLGITVNFAPDIDINNNPLNSAINTRSFGQDKHKVALFGIAYMKGMKENGVLGSAKHFPGHGDTAVDSHYDLPILPFTYSRIDTMELYPFKKLIDSGVDLIMVGHLQVPVLDSTGTPSSISYPIISNLLKRELGFKGLVITDALNMKGVSKRGDVQYLPFEAFKAGSDLILMPEKVSDAISIIESALQKNEIKDSTLDATCRKVLIYKQKLGLLGNQNPINEKNIKEDMNKPEYSSLNSRLSEQSIVLLQNRDSTIPFLIRKGDKVAYIGLGVNKNGIDFAKQLMKYTTIDTFLLREKYSLEELAKTIDAVENHNRVILAIHNTDQKPSNKYGLVECEMTKLTQLATRKEVSLVYFGNPYAIRHIPNYQNFASIIVGFTSNRFNCLAAAQLLFGALPFVGIMPVTSGEFSTGSTIRTIKTGRLSYGIPEDFDINGNELNSAINNIVNADLIHKRYTGAQFMLIIKGRVIISKAFGKVVLDELIELNRLSGLLSLLPAITFLSETKKVNTEGFIYEHIENFLDKDRHILLSNLLSHRSGLTNNQRDIDSIFPCFSYKNNDYLFKIIQKNIQQDLRKWLKSEVFEEMGMNNTLTSTDGKIVFSNVNDMAKYIAMTDNFGYYGGRDILSPEGLDLYNTFRPYYSSSPNGSYIWSDKERGIIMIFITNGTDSETSENPSKAGGLLRSVIQKLNINAY